ncbi:hypothetical protein GH714_009442 [Hevea brasiliensis]|uniref:YqaJ viral recombinase domain-containing protein n=1 Tax=Hevea brasiliensis TaxID=3981 RepID=A0A6A6M0Z4_HEVBR|nr:hypothetical protein GH714_009386 [Hevea brasiliensis]KAF2306013.1 hypothetical protein GH714_009442 [Hevea brasiliensis]
MLRTRWRITREEFVSCSSNIDHLSDNSCDYSFTIAARVVDSGKIRNYSRQSSLHPTSKSSTANVEIKHTSIRGSSYFHHLKSRTGEKFSVLQSSGLQHWFKNWQEQRKHKLTASTFAGAIGFWPGRRVQLWLEKIGAIDPFSGNLATCWNNIKEEEALERYKLITGNTVMFPEFQVYGERNPEDDWLGASPDGVIDGLVYGLPSRGVLEIKCPFFNGDMSNASPWKRIPLYHIPQAQGLMEILDRDWMDFYVWTPKGSSLFRLYRDVEYWDIMKFALADFWLNHVQPAREICKKSVISDPFIQLQPFKPAPRHDFCRHIVYESKHVVDSSKLLIREIHGILQN